MSASGPDSDTRVRVILLVLAPVLTLVGAFAALGWGVEWDRAWTGAAASTAVYIAALTFAALWINDETVTANLELTTKGSAAFSVGAAASLAFAGQLSKTQGGVFLGVAAVVFAGTVFGARRLFTTSGPAIAEE